MAAMKAAPCEAVSQREYLGRLVLCTKPDRVTAELMPVLRLDPQPAWKG